MMDFTPSSAQEQVLREQVFDESHPGWLLHDFEEVLTYVGTDGVKSSGKYNLLPMAALGELNSLLSKPLRLRLKRPQLRSHPYLQGLNLLLRASGLGRVSDGGEKARLALDPETLKRWRQLNPTEQYFNLLEAWLLNASPEMVGERAWGFHTGYLTKCVIAWRDLSPGQQRIAKDDPRELYLPGIHRDFFNLALMDLFGLVDVKQPAGPVATWAPAGVRRTEFGDAVFTILARELFGTFEEDDRRNEKAGDADEVIDLDEPRPGMLQPAFQPYFPAWRENLVLPEPEEREGLFVFKVSLGRVWRRIAVPSECTLDDLVGVILHSVEFDSDHLYEFNFRDRFGAEVGVRHPYCDEDALTSEVRVGALPLEPGDSMRLTYDLGDCWQFVVKLERIDPPDRKVKRPRVLESHGEAPEQYPGYDE